MIMGDKTLFGQVGNYMGAQVRIGWISSHPTVNSGLDVLDM